jgi:hypothetical protein
MQETQTCEICETEFSYKRPRSQCRKRLFCSTECAKKKRLFQNQQYREEGRYRAKSQAASRAKISKICIVCGNPFETVNRATQSCGTVCGHRLAMPKAQATRSANAKVRRTRACLRCGVPFVMRNPSGKARAGLANEGRYCSRACASAVLRKYPTKREARAAARQRGRDRLNQVRAPDPRGD